MAFPLFLGSLYQNKALDNRLKLATEMSEEKKIDRIALQQPKTSLKTILNYQPNPTHTSDLRKKKKKAEPYFMKISHPIIVLQTIHIFIYKIRIWKNNFLVL